MRLLAIPLAYSKMVRYKKIFVTLSKFGFYDIVSQLNVRFNLRLQNFFIRRFIDKEVADLSTPERLRRVFEELGPTFIKLGQILSLRPDLIPVEYANEFRKLQDRVPEFPYKKAKKIIEEELGKSAEDLFERIDETPVAAGSIAQVHRAVLKSGEEVALKVQRPDIRKQVETDIYILQDIARLLESNIPESKKLDPSGIVREFSRRIHDEMDFMNEARNAAIFGRNFKDDPHFHVFEIYWDYCTSRLFAMEYIDGIKIADFERLEAASLDPKTIAHNGARSVLRQVFEFGFFHADPHPGNLFVLDGNVIAPIDFGMMGRVDEEMKDLLSQILIGIVRKDISRIVKALRRMGVLHEEANLRQFRTDVLDLIDQNYDLPLSRIDFGKIVNQISALLHDYDIKLPSNLVIMIKAIVTAETVGRSLDPDFNIIGMIEPYIKKLISEKYSLSRQKQKIVNFSEDFADLVQGLPVQVQGVISKLNSGGLSMQMQHRGLDKMSSEVEKSSNRISVSLIIAALIIGSSIIMQTGLEPHFLGFPVIGIFGYLIAGVLGLWIVVNILRSGEI